MKLVIDMPEERYKHIMRMQFYIPGSRGNKSLVEEMLTTIRNGTPLPKGHGRLIDADKCIEQAWNDFYKHEDEWEKKDPDYVGVKRFHDQNGFECCLKTIAESQTVIESEEV